MASSHEQTQEQYQTSQITLKVWHPDCWTLETTERVNAGLITHGVYQHDGILSGRFTAYADTTEAIRELAQAIEESPLTDEIKCINEYFNPSLRTGAAGNATQELLVEYEPTYSIHDAFVSRGFVPEEEIRIHDGYEYWTVIVAASRGTIQQRLDEVRSEMDAEITVEGMKSARTDAAESNQSTQLSERQREVFELAQREGYYTWPRDCSASDLADQLDISKTTLLEHLRKAESKILGQLD
ncbi:MAG: helix-turn-helix domain-containing protein [Halolamina sp.]|uniref:helix-turn-helix domain-containing protein n=1 Tax=Halolamina sp. TaxID=1940283 RepID=UPI002FC3C4C4